MIQKDPTQIRALLVAQPNLARALFQAQVALGMLHTPQANGGMPQAAAPSPQQPQQPAPAMQPQQQQSAPAGHLHNPGMNQVPFDCASGHGTHTSIAAMSNLHPCPAKLCMIHAATLEVGSRADRNKLLCRVGHGI